jgi:hypothetical protein
MATKDARGRLKIRPRIVTAPTTSKRVVNIFEARRFSSDLLLDFSSVRTGTKAAESEVSANRSRRRLGIRKAALKASVDRLEPKSRAKTISRTRPSTRLIAVPMVKDLTPRAISSICRLTLLPLLQVGIQT